MSEEVSELSTEGDNDGHDKMGQRCQGRALGHVHVVDLLEVLGLSDQEKVEGPGSGEIGNNDGVHRKAGEH